MHKFVIEIKVNDIDKTSVADLRGSKFFQFHAVFGEIWQNCLLSPPGGLAPHLGEILDPPLDMVI